MSKEYLEAFKNLKQELYYSPNQIPDIDKWHETIEEALLRLEQIDNAIAICKKANEQKYVYIKETYGIVKEKFLDDLDYEVLNDRLYVNSRGMYYEFPLKDYGNWWALTKEEFE